MTSPTERPEERDSLTEIEKALRPCACVFGLSENLRVNRRCSAHKALDTLINKVKHEREEYHLLMMSRDAMQSERDDAINEVKERDERIKYLESVITQDGGVVADYHNEVKQARERIAELVENLDALGTERALEAEVKELRGKNEQLADDFNVTSSYQQGRIKQMEEALREAVEQRDTCVRDRADLREGIQRVVDEEWDDLDPDDGLHLRGARLFLRGLLFRAALSPSDTEGGDGRMTNVYSEAELPPRLSDAEEVAMTKSERGLRKGRPW
jgi:chromosome segregation ATPase